MTPWKKQKTSRKAGQCGENGGLVNLGLFPYFGHSSTLSLEGLGIFEERFKTDAAGHVGDTLVG